MFTFKLCSVYQLKVRDLQMFFSWRRKDNVNVQKKNEESPKKHNRFEGATSLTDLRYNKFTFKLPSYY